MRETRKNNNGEITAVSYLRTACVEQMARDRVTDNPAIGRQRRACDAKIAAIGAVKVGEFVSLGERAKRGESLSYRDMMAFVRARGATCVVVDGLGRLSRDNLESAALVRQLRAYEVELVSAREELDDPLLQKLMETMEYVRGGRWRARKQP
jgi:DNA invertase Pin-like site-specific DNA recombinase